MQCYRETTINVVLTNKEKKMSVKYSVVGLRNPRQLTEPRKFYAKAQAYGKLPLDEICDNVSHSGTIIRGDVLAVSDGLINQMISGLRAGKIVELGDFGHFQVQVQSQGAETAKEFTASNIKKAKIQFRPGKMLCNMLKILDYNQVAQLPKKQIIVE